MRVLVLVLVVLTSCFSWTSTLQVGVPHSVRTTAIDPACAQDCSGARDGTCLAACPGAVVEPRACPPEAEPGTCVDYVETHPAVIEGRCQELAANPIIVSCSEERSRTVVGYVGYVVGVGALIFVSLLIAVVGAAPA